MTDNTPDPTPVQKILVAELPEGREVTTYFVALDKEPATDRNGKSFLRLKLRDASGEVKAIHFDPNETVVDNLASGDVVKVSGTYSVHEKFGQQFQVKRLAVMAPGEYDIGTLVPVSPVPLEDLERRLAELIASVRSPSLHALLARAIDPSREPGATFLLVPAAVRNHHAYRHGLLEHSLIVAEVAAAVAERFSTVNRDLTVAGALLHDIGKVDSYSADPMAPGFTDVGRLHGEIVIGHDIVRGLTDEIADFPAEVSVQLRHIVVSHHGEREKGSPVVPATREAVIVHYCDDMTARLAAVDETAARTADGERWSRWVNMLDSYTYLAEAIDGPPVVPPVASDELVNDDDLAAGPELAEVDALADDMAPDVAAATADVARDDEPAGDDEPEPGDDEPEPTSHDGRGEPTGAALF